MCVCVCVCVCVSVCLCASVCLSSLISQQSCCLLLAHPLDGGHVANSSSGNISTQHKCVSLCVCVHACVCVRVCVVVAELELR